MALPPETPATIPVDEPTVATATLLLLHVPPLHIWLSGVIEPSHTVAAPDMRNGVEPNTIVVVAEHPDARV